MKPEASGRSAARRTLLWGVVLGGLALAAYWPALRAGFVWDDDTSLTGNGLIRAADGLRRIWLTREAPDYWPVTATSLWLEWRLWGMHALGYHATNLAAHLAAALLLWRVLERLRVPGAFLAACLFAVHPINVESVAWITQRKNLLAMLFFLLSVYWWVERVVPNALVRPATSPSALGTTRSTPYWLSLTAFLLAMLSKGSVAPLPIVLLGLVAWRRRITLRDWAAMLPFFAISGALTVVNLWFQGHGSGEIVRNAGPLERLLGAAAAVGFYVAKILWPHPLVFVYPLWRIQPGAWRWWVPMLAVLGATGALWMAARPFARSRPWGRPLLFAWAYFCAMLVPVMGLTDTYFMKYSLVADHYAHLAMIGAVAAGAAGWAWWRARAGWLPRFAAAAAIGGLMALTWRQCETYRDVRTLYETTLKRNPDCWMAHNNLALALAEVPGGLPEALGHYRAALRIKPDYAEAQANWANALAGIPGRLPEAQAHYEAALRIKPDFAAAQVDWANALAKIPGRLAEAVSHYEAALRIQPEFAEAEADLALVLAKLPGRLPDALVHYRAALRLKPDLAEVQVNLANELAKIPGGMPEALAGYERAVQIAPDNAVVRYNLALALAGIPGRMPEAATQYEAALRIDPANAAAHYQLANALAKIPGRAGDAFAHYAQALRLDPDNAEAQNNLAVLYARTGDFDEAKVHWESALALDPGLAQARNNLDRLLATRPPAGPGAGEK